MDLINDIVKTGGKPPRQVLPLSSGLMLLVAFLAVVIALVQVPVRAASAQSTTLILNPDSGDPPEKHGSLSGNGWCYPASSVSVTGTGVSGSAGVGIDGTLSGRFTVTGKAGDKVRITVSATCRAGGTSASATFKFTGQPTKTPVPPPANTPTPTPTLTPTETSTSTLPPTFTLTATPAEVPDQIVPYSGSNTLAIFGCNPPPGDVFLYFRQVQPAASDQRQLIPVAVEAASKPGLFVFEPPRADPGTLFAIDLLINSPECPTKEAIEIDLWTPGSSVTAIFELAGSNILEASSLGATAPNTLQVEIWSGGAWVTYLEIPSSPKGRSQLFKWTNNNPDIISGILQASVLPFPGSTEGDLLNPPGLVADWEVTCADCTFLIDTSSLSFESSEAQPTPTVDLTFLQQVFQTLKKFVSQVFDWTKRLLGIPIPPEPVVITNVSHQNETMVDLVVAGKITPPLISTFYFRVVPVYKNDIPGATSSQVKIQWYAKNELNEEIKKGFECLQNPNAPGCPTPVPPPLKPYTAEIIGYHGVVAPVNGHQGCYLVTKDTTVNYGTFSFDFLKGQKLCPPAPKEKSWYEAVIDFALDAVNWVSTAYNDLKSSVISIVSKFVPDALCGKKCLGTLLDAGLAALGLPPSIPNFDQLMNEGLDYLASQAAGQLGIPQSVYDSIDPSLTGIALQVALTEAEDIWKNEAEKQIKDGLKQGLEAAQYSLSKSVSWIPDGVPIKSDPLGAYQPPTLTLKVTRDAAMPPAADSCSGKAGVSGNLMVISEVAVSADQALIFNNSIASKNQQMKGGQTYYLYETMHVPLPNLAPGESQTIPVVLKPSLYSYWGAPWTSFNDAEDAWYTWYWNGQFKLSVFNACTKGDSIQGGPDQKFGP